MTDEVNDPDHYNQNGIEVIDVIETYAKTDFRLANVIKYVCRCEYKGNKLQDLEKAQWYLDRAINELLEDAAEEELLLGRKMGIYPGTVGQVLTTGSLGWEDFPGLDPETFPNDAEIDTERVAKAFDIIDKACDRALGDESWFKSTPAELYQLKPGDKGYTSTPAVNHHEFVSSLSERIAGEDETAQKLKDEYYKFDRYEIQGYCANCDAEIAKGQPFIRDTFNFDTAMFCGIECCQKLLEWQDSP